MSSGNKIIRKLVPANTYKSLVENSLKKEETIHDENNIDLTIPSDKTDIKIKKETTEIKKETTERKYSNNSNGEKNTPIKKYKFDLKDIESDLPLSNKKYKIKKLSDLKEKLAVTKSKLDEEFKKSNFIRYWKELDPFKKEKNIIAVLGNTCNISNAWIKCYELIKEFELLPVEILGESFIHFDNAAFPGSFILSVHHFVNTNRQWKEKYQWIGSSLLNSNDNNKSPLEDKYKLYENYPKNWLMNDINNGDVLVEENQKDFHKRLNGAVDLYTSDLGFDVSSDYNNQELLHAMANIGQILTGLLTLRKGGCLITKQYSIFEPITVSLMYATASFFNEFYICKPYSSREANSETYLVGKFFKGNATLDHPYIKAMLDRITKKINISIPLFDAKDYHKSYLDLIIKTASEIFDNQAEKINLDINRVYSCIKNKQGGHPSLHPVIIDYNETEKNKLYSWYYNNPIRGINDTDRLYTCDAFNQTKDALNN